MADFSNPLASLYPQPNQGGSLASDPSRIVGLIGQLNQNALFQKEFSSKQAIGNAFQGAIRPDGSFDPNAAALAVKNDPNAAFGAPDAVQAALTARGANIENATKALNLGVSNNSAVAGILAPYANQPSLSKEDQYNIKAKLAAAGVDPSTVAAADLTTPFKTLKAAQLGAVQSMGAGAAATRTPVEPSPEGAPQTAPLGSVVNRGAAPIPTAQSPIQVADQTEYLGDQTKAATTLANIRPLQQALPLIEKLSAQNFGPGSPELAQLKGILVTAGIMDPNSTSLPTRQDAQKYLNQYVGQSAAAGRSDMATLQERASRPNFDMTQPSATAMIGSQIGMDRMDAAAPLVAGSPNGYKTFKSKYYQSQDPRAYSFDLLSQPEQQKIIDSLGPPSTAAKKNPVRDKFLSSLKNAASVINPQQGQNGP